MEKKNIKEWFKDFWEENGQKIKIGVECLTLGLFVGFVKGVLTSDKIHSRETCKMIDKIPYEPDCNDIDDWVSDHMDELGEYYDFHKRKIIPLHKN